jgi:outer membrane murein-binding lipoprotein Lpp
MSDVNLDVNELIDSLSNEVATITRRAVIAEATSSARERKINELNTDILKLTVEVSRLEADLEQAKDVAKLKEKLESDMLDGSAQARRGKPTRAERSAPRQIEDESDIDFG